MEATRARETSAGGGGRQHRQRLSLRVQEDVEKGAESRGMCSLGAVLQIPQGFWSRPSLTPVRKQTCQHLLSTHARARAPVLATVSAAHG
jgi:hypothetical protein